MRPRFHTDAFYMPTADGVYLRSNRSHLTIKGKAIYHWLESLVPYFNGRYELEEITGDLDTDRKAMVTNLVETLLNNHFLSDASLDQPHTLSKEELDTYASEIAFIESFQASAAQRFETFRQMRVLVVGSGVAFSACIRACLHGGLKHLVMIRTAEKSALSVSSTLDESQLFLPRDPSQSLEEVSPPHWERRGEVLDAIRPFDAILHISDHPMLARVRLLNELCVEQQKIFLPACFLQGRAWVGPLVKPGSEGCWECAWHRLRSNIQEVEALPLYALVDQPDGALDRLFAFPSAAIAANQLVFTFFKLVAQADPFDTASQMSSIDLETLSCKSYQILPHFSCQSCQHPLVTTQASFIEQIEQLERREPLERTTFSREAACCFNDQLGIFCSIGEGNFEQIPLAVCKVKISNPTALPGCAQGQSVIATSLSFQDARQRSTQKACEVYAARAVNPRRLVMRVSEPDLVLPPESFLTTGLPSIVESWSWALHLQVRKPYLVPAPLAFPSLWSVESPESVERGIGSGMSWLEALGQALLDWACYLTIAQFHDRQQPYPKVDLHAISWESEDEHFLSLLTTAGALPDVYDVTGPLGVPTFAICTREQSIAYVSHYDRVQALSSGLERALRRFQSHYAQQSEYDVEPVPLLVPALRSDYYSEAPEMPIPQKWSARLIWIQQKLQEQGWYALAVPLNHDPALANVLPFLVRVLLARGEREVKQ